MSAALKVAVILGIQVDTVHHDHDRGVAQVAVHAQLPRREDHPQRLARAMEMPDQAFLRETFDHPRNDQVGALILLIAADNFDAAVLLVSGEQCEILQDIQHDEGTQHGTDGAMYIRQRALTFVFSRSRVTSFTALMKSTLFLRSVGLVLRQMTTQASMGEL